MLTWTLPVTLNVCMSASALSVKQYDGRNSKTDTLEDIETVSL